MGWWRCRHHSRSGEIVGKHCGRLPTSTSISSATSALRAMTHSWAIKPTIMHLPNRMRFDCIRHEYTETKPVPSQALGHCKAFRASSAQGPPPRARGRTQIALAMSSPMRILVVEDESKLAAHVCEGLRGAGFCPDHAPALADAQILVATVTYEAIVLDLALPDGNGLDLLREARRNGSSIAVLALTARDAVEDRVAGLDSGADDYLVKPFAMQELIARVRALLRRPGAVLGERLYAGNLTFDSRTRLIEVAGRPLSVPRRELLTLEALMRRAGRVISKDVLLDQIY